jgi:hypothetical protein
MDYNIPSHYAQCQQSAERRLTESSGGKLAYDSETSSGGEPTSLELTTLT